VFTDFLGVLTSQHCFGVSLAKTLQSDFVNKAFAKGSLLDD
jgi:hypothetical protein